MIASRGGGDVAAETSVRLRAGAISFLLFFFSFPPPPSYNSAGGRGGVQKQEGRHQRRRGYKGDILLSGSGGVSRV